MVCGMLQDLGIISMQRVTDFGFGSGGEMALGGGGAREILVRAHELQDAQDALDGVSDQA